MKQGAKLNSIVIVSDEAFTLLMLENYWDSMEAMDEDDFYKPKKQKTSDNTSNTCTDNTEETKATVTGKWTRGQRGSRRFSGWEPQGLLRFNELVQAVVENREQDLHFETQYKIHMKKNIAEKSTKNNKVQATTVAVYCDLDSLSV